VKGLPEALQRQFEYEDPIVRGGKQLLHSPFFKVILDLFLSDDRAVWLGEATRSVMGSVLCFSFVGVAEGEKKISSRYVICNILKSLSKH
jgi:hypothetical protein